ncbi:hypothetical protein BDW22DRAFT_1425082 [Trametopsis cervina]|nr:hypothetical protein BDW22DRAFT_1425082 [Trametopsis cervina]
MDFATVATDSRTEDVDIDRKRLDAFKLGGSAPAPSGLGKFAHQHSHSRSHSRHNSSVSFSVPPVSSLPPLPLNSPPASPPAISVSKRNSHHRRRSSVSTRRESAEIMGVTLPSFPSSTSEDNINLGDKDSIRRRALLALEGRTEVGAFSRVEIPEIGTPEIEKQFSFPSKPSYPPGIGAGFSGGLSSLSSSKRDSLGKLMSMSSSKDMLGTLVEEEEEEESADKTDDAEPGTLMPAVDSGRVPLSMKPTTVLPVAPARPKPATLKLRPLSLSPHPIQATNGDLPTLSPSPSARPGLKSLTLPASLSSDDSSITSGVPAGISRRQSLTLVESSQPAPPIRRSTVSGPVDHSLSYSARRSSLSYFSSEDKVHTNSYGLPTPEMTPVSESHPSRDSTPSDQSRSSRGSRTLSASEQHFLYQAHNALVRRISDLERALSARPRSRPGSSASDSSDQSNSPSNEMFQLIADLKAERDELKKDADGWRARIVDYEHQVALLVKRLEAERREAWVARERVGMMEFEKKAVETSLAEKTSWGEDGWRKFHAVQNQLTRVEKECTQLRAEASHVPDLELEVARLTMAFAEERKKREEVEKELESVLSTPTPQAFELSQYRTPPVSRTMVFAKRGGLGFRSVDSTSSSTDVESVDDPFDLPSLSLKVVHEEDEDDGHRSDCTDPEDDLACYEEEDENDDYVFQASASDSSFGSDCDEPRDTSHLTEMSMEADSLPELSSSGSSSSSPSPAPPSPPQGHSRRASLIKAWTFPQSAVPSPLLREVEEIDHFFGCLEDVDNSPPLDSKLRSVESEKNLFSLALADAEDDFPPFMIPSNVGVEVPVSGSRFALDSIAEDEEEEDTKGDFDEEIVGQEVEGGIIFTFTPPPSFETQELPVFRGTSPPADEQSTAAPAVSPAPSLPPTETPPPSIRRSSPGKTFASNIPVPSFSTPIKSALARSPSASDSSAVPSTPIKRLASPSSIPRRQPLPSSSPIPATPPKTRSSSFIPQPRKGPVTALPSSFSTPAKGQNKPCTSMLNSSEPSEPATPHYTVADIVPTCPTAGMKPDTSTSSPRSPFTSPTFAAIQTFTNFISLPWSSPKMGFSSSATISTPIPQSNSTSTNLCSDRESSFPAASSPAKSASVSRGPLKRSYVPKERQLAKLKLRLEQESLSARFAFSNESVVSRQRCSSGVVEL